ncbi:hypothetical protein AN619_14920 [Thermotalea metallivorans]|uniref:Uncharacterized protein n=1 Tax=Thermotalea metallivorans TaxID=520762 RepID=A0A140L5B3_9FIRM|nr:hypothetical protein AN619_14920 [Thermotalea metallivorans]
MEKLLEELSFEIADLDDEEVTMDDHDVKLKLKDSITARNVNKCIL